jgi:hypothetical protein
MSALPDRLFPDETGTEFFAHRFPRPIFAFIALGLGFLDGRARLRVEILVIFTFDLIESLECNPQEIVRAGEGALFHLVLEKLLSPRAEDDVHIESPDAHHTTTRRCLAVQNRRLHFRGWNYSIRRFFLNVMRRGNGRVEARAPV